MPNIVLGLQGGQANGTESTFDGQPMQAGTHLRWSFAPELGFRLVDFGFADESRRRASSRYRFRVVCKLPVSYMTALR